MLPHDSNNASNSGVADDIVRNFGGLARPNAVIPSPNEHLYSSLYGREMEMMRKMFKSGDKLDDPSLPATKAGGYPTAGGPLASSGYPPHMFAGANAAKYFDGMSVRPGGGGGVGAYDQLGDVKAEVAAAKHATSVPPVNYPIGHPFAGAGVRPPPSSSSASATAAAADSQLFEHIVHSSNSSSSGTASNGNSNGLVNANAKHQGLLKPSPLLFNDDKHFNINFNNNNSNSNNNNNNNNNININNNNLNTESSLNKSYPGGAGSFDAQSHPIESPTTTNHSLLLNESQFVNHQLQHQHHLQQHLQNHHHHHPHHNNNNHNFNVTSYANCDKDTHHQQRLFVGGNNKSPGGNSDFLGARTAADFDMAMENKIVDAANKNRRTPSAVSPTASATSITSSSSSSAAGNTLAAPKGSTQCNIATKLLSNKHEQREFVNNKSHGNSNNNHSDDDEDDDEFTNL